MQLKCVISIGIVKAADSVIFNMIFAVDFFVCAHILWPISVTQVILLQCLPEDLCSFALIFRSPKFVWLC